MIVKDINFYKKYRYLIKENLLPKSVINKINIKIYYLIKNVRSRKINNIFEYIELDKIKHIVRFRDLPIEDKCFII